MGGSSSKQELMAQLEELDQREFQMNLQLKEMQTELNSMVPKNEQIKINADLTPNSKIIRAYDVIALGGRSSSKNVGNKKDGRKSKLKKTKDDKN